ncbi:REP-associated tyrosine transposase [Flexithrix dorotheae]|uniref:REP-associated tyrosine transposase n=1 Tax=Flexithrix dorotheae TaxID=70993 RepID=UPI0003A99CBD|nr:transposase [Flexithrix dorotheae]
MGHSYVIRDQGAMHFVIFTVHQWVDVFTRSDYVALLLESLRFCQKDKGLEIYAWVIMSNHCHLIVRAKNKNLSDIIRDFKKFTSKKIFKAIESNPQESRKKWLVRVLKYQDRIWFWQEGYHGEEVVSKNFLLTKVEYIHMNPVRAGIVEKEEEYLLSSAGDFYGIRKGRLELSSFD